MNKNEPKDDPEFRGTASLEAADSGKDLNADLDKRVENETKANAAVALAVYGASYTDIAKRLGYSSAFRARQAVERMLASVGDSTDSRDHLRKLFDKRFNRLLQSHFSRAVDPKDPQQLAYSARVLQIMDRAIRMHGLDAPTQVAISATDDQIAQYLSIIRPMADADAERENLEIIDLGEMDGEGDGES